MQDGVCIRDYSLRMGPGHEYCPSTVLRSSLELQSGVNTFPSGGRIVSPPPTLHEIHGSYCQGAGTCSWSSGRQGLFPIMRPSCGECSREGSRRSLLLKDAISRRHTTDVESVSFAANQHDNHSAPFPIRSPTLSNRCQSSGSASLLAPRAHRPASDSSTTASHPPASSPRLVLAFPGCTCSRSCADLEPPVGLPRLRFSPPA